MSCSTFLFKGFGSLKETSTRSVKLYPQPFQSLAQESPQQAGDIVRATLYETTLSSHSLCQALTKAFSFSTQPGQALIV